MVPFILLSRTGFTIELVDMCTSLCMRGMNFHSIETSLMEHRLDTIARQQEMHNMIGGMCACAHDLPFLSSPSNDIISKFLKDEHLYLKEMMSILPGESISFDHTFKVAANIRSLREDGVWAPQYDSLFAVLNI